jgi:hypothetical protein
MSASTVQAILDQIERLPEADRVLLQQRLAELADAEWQREAEAARRQAQERGIDQATIDQAVHDLRYGK